MLKKYGILAAGLLMNVTPLLAYTQYQDQQPAPTNLYTGGFVTGMGLTTLETIRFFGGNAGAEFQFGYYGKCWMFDIGANYATKPSHTFLIGHLGPRNRLYQNLFISYGAMGLGNIVPGGHGAQWAVGAFTGLDYQFSEHFLLSGKIYPYNYDHRVGRFKHNVFANSTISLFYVY